MWSINSISQTPLKKETISAINLLIFNPEHDYALAVGEGPYTPPRAVVDLRKKYALLPAVFAGNSDFILIPEDLNSGLLEELPYFDLTLSKHLTLIKPSGLGDVAAGISKIIPWGWNHNLKRFLLDYGLNENILPSDYELENIRKLSHRKTIIPFRQEICRLLNIKLKYDVSEVHALEEVENYLTVYPEAFFKAPWSSSGRGIVASDHIKRKGLLEWAAGTLRRQGSIICEPRWNRNLDFASEWYSEKGNVKFLGVSVFKTSDRGKYHGNIYDSQEALMNIIKSKAPDFSFQLIEAQKKAIESLISPYYTGPLGIDMLSDADGSINPCVEINIRLTMGHLHLLSSRELISNT
ncbi:MAG: hypothetical protein J1E82_02420 [Muribaculaceae bacterium]|nr:hypothetical protein [Muribaculaceae bacterium]